MENQASQYLKKIMPPTESGIPESLVTLNTTDGVDLELTGSEVQSHAQETVASGSTNPILVDVADGSSFPDAYLDNGDSQTTLEAIEDINDNELVANDDDLGFATSDPSNPTSGEISDNSGSNDSSKDNRNDDPSNDSDSEGSSEEEDSDDSPDGGGYRAHF